MAMACQHVGAATLMGGRARRAPMALVRPIAAGWAPSRALPDLQPTRRTCAARSVQTARVAGCTRRQEGLPTATCGAGVHCRAVAELDAVCIGFKCGRLGWDDHQSPPSPSSTDRGLATIATATFFAAPLVSAPDLTLPRAPPGSPPSPPHARWRQHRRLRCHYPHHCRISPYAALTFARRPSPLPALPVPALSVANLAAALLAALADADLVTLALPNAIH